MQYKFFIQKTEEAADIPLPQYMTEGAVGMDLCACVAAPVVLAPGEYKAIPTGIKIAMPKGFEVQIRPRSGLAAKFGVTTLNAPGTIDSDYRGEIRVLLINHSRVPFTVKRGERIAQMVIAKYEQVEFIEVEELDDTDRGDGGFGHTGY